MNPTRLTAIVLSAGYSRRAGRFKPLLALGATTLVERAVRLYRTAGIPDVCVVIGHRADEVRDALRPLAVRCVINPQFASGMYSSLVAGLRTLPHGCGGFFVHPVDIPLVRRSTIAALVAGASRFPGVVLHPCFQGRRGHPPLVPAALAAGILDWPGHGGLRGFWESGHRPMRDIPVADEGILLDLDTEADYRRLTARCERQDLPTAAECRTLLEDILTVPEAIRVHGRAVAGVAVKIAVALVQAGIRLDIDLIRAAALLHDIAHGRPNHAAAGAALLEELDYPRLAAPVRLHMDITVDPDRPPDEAGVLFLADKLVAGSRLVPPEERFQRKMADCGDDARARAAIERRRIAARTIRESVERFSGQSVEDILADVERDGTVPA